MEGFFELNLLVTFQIAGFQIVLERETMSQNILEKGFFK
jgi:hypothetical protein